MAQLNEFANELNETAEFPGLFEAFEGLLSIEGKTYGTRFLLKDDRKLSIGSYVSGTCLQDVW